MDDDQDNQQPERSLQNWRRRDEGPLYIKIGGQSFYPLSMVREWESLGRKNGRHAKTTRHRNCRSRGPVQRRPSPGRRFFSRRRPHRHRRSKVVTAL
jgi:hypothetical protein